MTYLILDLLFLLTIVLFLPKKLTWPSKKWVVSLAVILVLTAIFDPIIIALHIVAYDSSKVLGVYWFGAPIEDFFYTLYAVTIVPLIWKRLGEGRRE